MKTALGLLDVVFAFLMRNTTCSMAIVALAVYTAWAYLAYRQGGSPALVATIATECGLISLGVLFLVGAAIWAHRRQKGWEKTHLHNK